MASRPAGDAKEEVICSPGQEEEGSIHGAETVQSQHFVEDELVTFLQYPLEYDSSVPSSSFDPFAHLNSLALLHGMACNTNPVVSSLKYHALQQEELEWLDNCASGSSCGSGAAPSKQQTMLVDSQFGNLETEEQQRRSFMLPPRVPFAGANTAVPVTSSMAGYTSNQSAARKEKTVDGKSASKPFRKILPALQPFSHVPSTTNWDLNRDADTRDADQQLCAVSRDRNCTLHQIVHNQRPLVLRALTQSEAQLSIQAANVKRVDASVVHDEKGEWLSDDMETATANRNFACSTADAALALGAGPAAGVVPPLAGVEAFGGVRTFVGHGESKAELQPLLNPRSLLPTERVYSSNQFGASSSMLSPRLESFGAFGLSTVPASPSLVVRKDSPFQHVLPISKKAVLLAPSNASQENTKLVSFSPLGASSSKDASMDSSTTAWKYPEEVEETTASRMQHACMNPASSRLVPLSTSASGSDVIDIPKASGVGTTFQPAVERKVEYHDMISGGSHTTESLKAAAPTAKLKPENLELYSEEAEGESAFNSKARSSGAKRSRANEVHNLSERRRRTRINDKMNALRQLIPNANKSNKASLLDEAVEYIKSLQLQLQVMSMRTGVSLSPMALPPNMPGNMQLASSPMHGVAFEMTGATIGMIPSEACRTKNPAIMVDNFGVYGAAITRAGVYAPVSAVQMSTLDLPLSAPQLPIMAASPCIFPESSISTKLVSLYYPHLHVQDTMQNVSAMNLDMYRTLSHQRQQFQMLRQNQFQQRRVGGHNEQPLEKDVESELQPEPQIDMGMQQHKASQSAPTDQS